jgi:DNA-binding response OmpR family regulator
VASILVVEDDLSVQRVLARALEQAGHTVLVAPDGRHGLFAFREARPDLVITDLLMPEMNGIELALILRAADPRLPIIAITGRERTEVLAVLKASAASLGAVELLTKPFTPGELLAAVDVALMRQSDRSTGDAAG